MAFSQKIFFMLFSFGLLCVTVCRPPMGSEKDCAKKIDYIQSFKNSDSRISTPETIRENQSSIKWNKTRMTYFIENKPQCCIPKAVIELYIKKAFQKWAWYVNIKVQDVKFRTDADIIISFKSREHGDNYPFEKTGFEVAHTKVSRNEKCKSFIHFNYDQQWTVMPDSSKGELNFFQIALHEIGQIFGMDDSTKKRSIMVKDSNDYDSINSNGVELKCDDIFTITKKYGTEKKIPTRCLIERERNERFANENKLENLIDINEKSKLNRRKTNLMMQFIRISNLEEKIFQHYEIRTSDMLSKVREITRKMIELNLESLNKTYTKSI